MENLIVNKTKNYSLFKTMSSNRQVNLSHVKNLMRSMSENGVLINPIIVNEKFEVIDGQHRLRACTDLDMPVYYLIAKDYRIKEVHALNLNQKNWSNQDYLEAYSNDGNINYKRMLKFQQENKNFTFSSIITFITGVSGFHLKDSFYENEKDGKRQDGVKGIGFKEGRMIVSESDIIKAQVLADMFNTLKNTFELYNNNTFIGSMIVIMNNVKEFDFNEFKNKCEKYRDKLYRCSNRSGYYKMIHDFYNYKKRIKLNLYNPLNR
tara:strand:- start:510 stop:1301 length:792 start_codon:yes stop_codon:yes gene_type:complete